MYPNYKLDNMMNTSLGELADSKMATDFGNAKRDKLPQYCPGCSVRFACNGECPKHRFTWTPDGEWGLNYLCPAYKKFFKHIDPAMNIMADLYNAKRAPAEVMQILADQRKKNKGK